MFETENKGGRMEKYNNILKIFFIVEIKLKKFNTVFCHLPPAFQNIISSYLGNVVRNKTLILTEQSEWKQKYQDNLPASKQILCSQCNFKQLLLCTSSHSCCISFLPFLAHNLRIVSLVILLFLIL